MPGILSSTTDLTVYIIEDPAAVTADKLKRHAFRSIDDLKTEELAAGWTSIDGMLDTAWESAPPEKGEWLCFALRVDKRSIPAAVFKKRYAEALKAEEDAIASSEGERRPIGRKRRSELKEQVRLRLLPTVEPAPTVVDVAMNMHTGLIFVASSAKSVLTQFEELMASSFGVIPRRQESGMDVPQELLRLYNEDRLVERDGNAYTLSYAGQMTLAGLEAQGENAVQVVVKNDNASADAGIASGLGIARIRLTMMRDAETWSFALNDSLGLLGVKTPAVENRADDKDNPDAAMLEKLYLLEQLVGVVTQLFELK